METAELVQRALGLIRVQPVGDDQQKRPPAQATQLREGEHWVYRVWSKVLDGEVWWAHCGGEVHKLLQRGISRGVIYTESEMNELLHLPRPCDQALRDIHLLKLYFDGTVIGEETE
jgi:hypothetical protein